jgi:site-specific DNA recombinase
VTTRHQYADLYLRVSIDRDGKTAIERQELDCRSWTGEHDLKVRRVHVDRGRSGYLRGAGRKGLTEALTAVSSGVVGTLVVWKLDRLSRQGIGQVGQLLEDIGEAGGRLVSVQDDLDTADSSDRRMIEMLAEQARSESENLSLRVRSAKQYLRSQGRWIGGAPPYGLVIHDGRLAVDPVTGPVVRQIADRILAGASLVEVARWLNDSGVPSPRGGRWGVGSIAQLVRSPAIAGLLPETLKHDDGQYSGSVIPWRDPDTGEPVTIMSPGQRSLISPPEQLRIMSLFDERTRLSTYGERQGRRAPDSQHLLTGLLRCSSCSERMSKQGNSYRCQSVRLGRRCDAPGGAYQPALDAAVVQIWMNRLETLDHGEPLHLAIVEQLVAAADPEAAMRRSSVRAALADAQAALVSADQDHYIRRIVDRDRYLSLNAVLAGRIEELGRVLEAMSVPVVDTTWLRDPVLLREKWSAATVRERRELLKLAVEEIRVSQGRHGARFVPDDRVTVIWLTDVIR